MKKSNIVFPSVTLVIGYLIGSLLFPINRGGNSDADTSGTTAQPPSISRSASENMTPQPQPKPRVESSNPIPPPQQLSGDAAPPESLQKAERAKWLRLIEVLGLDSDQAKALEAAIAQNRPIPNGDSPLDVAYTEAGDNLEQAILALLTPEQQDAFREMQERSLETQVEAKAQAEFAESLAKIDLSTEQREQVMEILRRQAEADVSNISSGTQLLLGQSFLPIGDEKLTLESFELLGQLQVQPGAAPTTIEELTALHRVELERRMSQFNDILTPAQLALYQASLAQAMENLDIISPR